MTKNEDWYEYVKIHIWIRVHICCSYTTLTVNVNSDPYSCPFVLVRTSLLNFYEHFCYASCTVLNEVRRASRIVEYLTKCKNSMTMISVRMEKYPLRRKCR